MTRLILTCTLLCMAGCDLPSGAMVTDFNGSSVKVQTFFASIHADADAQALATKTCQKAGKATAEPASSQIVASDSTATLFICN